MPAIPDPFEAFREKRKLEELEQRVRSSPQVKCPGESDLAGKPTSKKSSAIRPAFDPSKAWIY